MWRFFLRYFGVIPLALLLANFAGFAYAHFALSAHMQRNPFFAPLEKPAPIVGAYSAYLTDALTNANIGTVPLGAGVPMLELIANAALASLGLLAISFAASVIIGLLLGVAAVRVEPPGVHRWLSPVTTFGLAMPGFYLGTLMVIGVLAAITRFGSESISIPTSGFGWDAHLLLPALALMLRPAVQIAQVSANLLSAEFAKRYITTARAVGNTWRTVRWKHALGNALAPIILSVAGSFRLMLAELVVVEWLFAWPGLGRLLAFILIPSRDSHAEEGILFLMPTALAAVLTVFAFLFIVADSASSFFVRIFDPRTRTSDLEVADAHG